MSAFDLVVPERGETPVLVEIPHAGLAVPDSVRELLAIGSDAIERDADIYVDKLYTGAEARGATVLCARISRYVVDLNRAADDVDGETVEGLGASRAVQPRGVVWRMTTSGAPALVRRLQRAELDARIDEFHAPYHATIERELGRLRDRFGFAILLAAHSMPSVGRSGHGDPGVRRADIVPGSRGRTSADPRVIDLVDAYFRAAGLSVRHDDPYRGGFSTGHYGRPSSGWHAIQVEVNRALYVDEETLRPRTGDFERMRALLLELVERLGRVQL
jgi:N-formylglutamate amidohydrolase